MNYALVIQCPPSAPGACTSLQFCKALLSAGHHIGQVFFYGEGVYIANQSNTPAQDESDITGAWANFLSEHEVASTVCIAAATTRGMLDEEEQSRYEKQAACIQAPFTLSGLGALVEAAAHSDRLITFN